MLNKIFSIIIYFFIHRKINKIYKFVFKNFDLDLNTITQLNKDLNSLTFDCNNDSFKLEFSIKELKEYNRLFLSFFSHSYLDFNFSYISSNQYNETFSYNYIHNNLNFYNFKYSSLIELYKIINNLYKEIKNYKINQNNEILNYFDFKELEYVK